MPVRNTLHYILMKSLNISKKEAKGILEAGRVTVNGSLVSTNVYFEKTDEIKVDGNSLNKPFRAITILYHKPAGIECTMNPNIPCNLAEIFPQRQDLFPVGRLDKASEGLLLLTNSGKLYRDLNHYHSIIEKEYLVRVNGVIDEKFVMQMEAGIEIMGKMTLPCEVQQTNYDTFKIILKQGLNRQIRRMCYKLGFDVISLIRVRIGHYHLGDLKEGEWEIVDF